MPRSQAKKQAQNLELISFFSRASFVNRWENVMYKNLVLILICGLLSVGCGAMRGEPGTPGSTGPEGPQGEDGATGATGVTGATGPGGSNCTVQTVPRGPQAPAGGALVSCQDGTSVVVLNGTGGAPGASPTPIQFCSGATTYPTEFSEVGVCLGGKLYAVYSANGGFLSEIPPGTYSSDGINSSCTFTVGPDCEVSQ